MKKIFNSIAFVLFFILGTFLFSSTASAYIDPSAMTYIVQIVVGIVIAGGAAFGFYFKKIKRKLKKKNAAQDDYVSQDDIDYSDDDEFSINNLSDDDFEITKNKK